MLEWVCPKCDRAVDPAFTICPFCAGREVAAAQQTPAARREARRAAFRADVERGFRFGLGFVAVLALVYFLLFLVAYFGGDDSLLSHLTRWLYRR